MANSVVDIYNLALSACGTDLGVTSPTENSREAAACRLWYPLVSENVLKSAPWPSVQREVRLAQVAARDGDEPWSVGDPPPQYAYAFAAPDNMLQPYHLHSYAPFVYRGGRISCDEPTPILVYNATEPDVSKWDTGLTMAVVYMLAVSLAIPLTGKTQRLEANAQLAVDLVTQARVDAANSSTERREALPDWIQARGYSDMKPIQFVYPWASLNFNAAQ